jgi:prepilin-type N-terminal cleavage/methylation domain-containing protein
MRNDSRSGFTLIEILVALMVLALGLVSVFALFGLATATHRRGVDAQTVADLAMTTFAEIETRFARDEPQDLSDQSHPLFSRGYLYGVQFIPLGGAGGQAYLVRLTITWQTRGKRHSETFERVMFLAAKAKKK